MANITFLQDAEIEVVETYDEETDTAESSDEIFRKGEKVEVDIFGRADDNINVQFGDGSCCFGLPLAIVEVEFDNAEEKLEYEEL